MGLKTVLDLRERQKEEAALALAVERRRRDEQERALNAAVARRDAIPTSAMSADDLDLFDRAARAAERSIQTAKKDLQVAEHALLAQQTEHQLRSMQHQSVLRISERRAEEHAVDERRKEQRATDDHAARRAPTWI